MPTDPLLTAAYGLDVALCLAGGVLAWRLGRSEIRRPLKRVLPAFAPWVVSPTGIVLAFGCVCAGAYLGPLIVSHLSNAVLGPAASDSAWWTVIQGTAFQVGLLAGVGVAALVTRPRIDRVTASIDFLGIAPLIPAVASDSAPAPAIVVREPTRHPLMAGVVTFLIVLPLIFLIGFIWKTLLETFGCSVDEQEMVGLFRDCESLGQLLFMTVLVAVLAPLTEELVFRAGLFRYLRTRIPRWLAVVAPAALFAALHCNLVAFVPLLALGVFFSLSYERTGRIAVPVIAHALFNFHTVLLILAGVSN